MEVYLLRMLFRRFPIALQKQRQDPQEHPETVPLRQPRKQRPEVKSHDHEKQNHHRKVSTAHYAKRQ